MRVLKLCLWNELNFIRRSSAIKIMSLVSLFYIFFENESSRSLVCLFSSPVSSQLFGDRSLILRVLLSAIFRIKSTRARQGHIPSIDIVKLVSFLLVPRVQINEFRTTTDSLTLFLTINLNKILINLEKLFWVRFKKQ
jgi:hypothetical protein